MERDFERKNVLKQIALEKEEKKGKLVLSFKGLELGEFIDRIVDLNLEALILYRCELHKLPDSFVRLQSLRDLEMKENEFKIFPDCIIQLKNLQNLDLRFNNLGTLPDSIGQLKNLQNLDLSDNELTSLPDSIGQLQNLQNLDLSYNDLVTIPDSIGQLKKLQNLDLSDNEQTSLPDSIGQLQNLQELNLYNNKLTTLPDSFGQLQNLQELNLCKNKLTTFPDSIGQLQNLHELDLSYNDLVTIPDWIGQLQNLHKLTLHNNKLTTIPDSFGQLQNLQELDLNNNYLTILPDSFAQLQALSLLDLSDTEIHVLPDYISTLYQLTILRIYSDHLKDIPLTIAGLPKLKELYFNHSRLPDDHPFKEYGFAGVYKLLVQEQRNRVHVKVVEMSAALTEVFQEYLTGFQNRLRKKGLSVTFFTKTVEKGLHIEVELPEAPSSDLEEHINQLLLEYMTLIHPDNIHRTEEMLNKYFSDADKFERLRLETKVKQFEQGEAIYKLALEQNDHRLIEKDKQISKQGEQIDKMLCIIEKIGSDKFSQIGPITMSPNIHIALEQKSELHVYQHQIDTVNKALELLKEETDTKEKESLNHLLNEIKTELQKGNKPILHKISGWLTHLKGFGEKFIYSHDLAQAIKWVEEVLSAIPRG